MTIDWLTVSAQIVNFLILVWILKRLLYQPVLDAMAAREQRIAARLDAAGERERQAQAAADEHRRAREQLAEARERILSEARAAAEEERKRMEAQARAELAVARDRWQQEVNAEKAEFLDRLQRRSVEAVTAMARKTLTSLADADLQSRMVAVFEQRLQHLDADARRTLAEDGGPLEVVTAFELGDGDRRRVESAVRAIAGPERAIEFASSPELICGIELIAGGHRVSWNVADFADDLAERIDHVLSHASERHYDG